jgi:NAD(P)-dependent dehydrogenase (short-subunit alcohol dehydrogenase family)
MDLQGKLALVTGGAVRVGRETALELARAGADVIIHYHRDREKAEQAVAQIKSLGRQSISLRADLTDPSQVEKLFADVARHFGRLDVLVNNAATYNATPWESLTAEAWDKEFNANARAPALCIRHALGLMKANGGAIVNITDIKADNPRADFPAYCAAKAALVCLTRSAAKALARHNIRVNAVAPGVAEWSGQEDGAYRKLVLSRIPLRRIGTPQYVAQAVVFLAGHDYITGVNLHVDGGWDMR